VFTLHASDDPIGWADNVSTFERVDPAVLVHPHNAMSAGRFSSHIWMAKIPHDMPLTLEGFVIRIERFARIVRMVPVPEPLSRINHNGLLSELRHLNSLSVIHAPVIAAAVSSLSASRLNSRDRR
jgi:hypothetical protein